MLGLRPQKGLRMTRLPRACAHLWGALPKAQVALSAALNPESSPGWNPIPSLLSPLCTPLLCLPWHSPHCSPRRSLAHLTPSPPVLYKCQWPCCSSTGADSWVCAPWGTPAAGSLTPVPCPLPCSTGCLAPPGTFLSGEPGSCALHQGQQLGGKDEPRGESAPGCHDSGKPRGCMLLRWVGDRPPWDRGCRQVLSDSLHIAEPSSLLCT